MKSRSRAGVRRQRGRGSPEGGAQPPLLDAEVPVLAAVDHDHRHAVAVLRAQLGVGVDVDAREAEPQVGADARDVGLGHLAQVTAHAGVDEHPLTHDRASWRRAILPVGVRGSSRTKTITAGTLNRASRSAQNARTAASSTPAAGSVTSTALTTSPARSSRCPTTAASVTPSI